MGTIMTETDAKVLTPLKGSTFFRGLKAGTVAEKIWGKGSGRNLVAGRALYKLRRRGWVGINVHAERHYITEKGEKMLALWNEERG